MHNFTYWERQIQQLLFVPRRSPTWSTGTSDSIEDTARRRCEDQPKWFLLVSWEEGADDNESTICQYTQLEQWHPVCCRLIGSVWDTLMNHTVAAFAVAMVIGEWIRKQMHGQCHPCQPYGYHKLITSNLPVCVIASLRQSYVSYLQCVSYAAKQ